MSEYGARLLRKSGWKAGHGVGRDRDKEVDALLGVLPGELRPAGLGLGAVPKDAFDDVLRRSKEGRAAEGAKGQAAAKPAAVAARLAGGGWDSDSPMDDDAPDSRGVAWLVPGIRVRVVSRGLRGGSLFRKKAEVVDVPREGVAVLELDGGGGTVAGVEAADLETALPRAQGAVLCVGGRHRGRRGTLMHRDKAAQVAVVHLDAVGGWDWLPDVLATVSFDHVAEHVIH